MGSKTEKESFNNRDGVLLDARLELPDEEISRLMTDEEKLDEALRESFPASDPLGFMSKSIVDKNMQ